MDAIREGDIVSHYRVDGRLGEGGMGVVYRATDVNLRRPVALKFLPPARAADARARARFVREARAASALDHPNIGVVYEIGDDGDLPFIAMALYEGETLAQRLARGPLPVEEAERIASGLALALEAAHAAGIVHRDLKPANVMLTTDGGIKLLDFGLAKLTSDESQSLTRDGAVLGTLSYMAPEQLRGEELDGRADLWALGAILYEMLTARPAFPGGSVAVVTTRILHEAPPKLLSTAPPHLARLVERLLCRELRHRIATAGEVASLLAHRIVVAPPPRRRRWLRIVAIAVGVPLALFVALVIYGISTQKPVDWWPREKHKTGRAKLALRQYEPAARDLEFAYEETGDSVILFDLADAYRLGGHRGRALDAYRNYLRYRPDAPNRAEAEQHIAELTPSPAPAIAEEPADDRQVLAREVFTSASDAFQRKDYDAAARAFERAYVLANDPVILYNAAQSFRLAGQSTRAIIFYQSFLSAAPASPIRRDVEARIRELRAQAH
jgi:hypothetical protein